MISFLLCIALIAGFSYLSIATCLQQDSSCFASKLMGRIFPSGVVVAIALAKFSMLFWYPEAVGETVNSSVTLKVLAVLTIGLFAIAETLLVIPFLRVSIFRKAKTLPANPRKTIPIESGKDPSVTVMIMCADESAQTLKRSIETASKLDYDNKIIYLIENSRHDTNKETARQLASEAGIEVESIGNQGGKGAAINQALKLIPESEYVFIVDADQKLASAALSAAMDVACRMPDVAVVVSPQSYSTDIESPIGSALRFQMDCYARVVMPAMNKSGCTIMVGTNCLIKREILVRMGGFDTTTNTEDYCTSFFLHLNGERTTLLYKWLGKGLAPFDFYSYSIQQARWAQGGIMVFKKVIRNLVVKPHLLSPGQWLHYLFATSHYTFSFGFMFFLFIAAAQCFAGYSIGSRIAFILGHARFLGSLVAVATACGAILYTTGSVVILRIAGKDQRRDFWRASVLTLFMCPVYLASCFAGLMLRRAQGFEITPREHDRCGSVLHVIPQMAIVILCILAAGMGVSHILGGTESPLVIFTCVFWCGFTAIVYITGIFLVLFG